MPTANTSANEETRIRSLIDNWASAMRARDSDGVVSHYAPDNVKFILAPPLQYTRDNPFAKKAWKSGFLRSEVRSTTKIGSSALPRATTSLSAIV
jgi:ketosteroid isomerase-like protein